MKKNLKSIAIMAIYFAIYIAVVIYLNGHKKPEGNENGNEQELDPCTINECV